MVRTRAGAAVAVFVVAASVVGCSGRGSDPRPDLAGTTVEVVAVWDGVEQRRFERVLHRFEAATGATVRYTSTAGQDIGAVLTGRVAAGRAPDVALLPQPGLLRRFAAQGAVFPVGGAVRDEVRRRYPAVWRRLASVDGALYGVWFKAANKSLVWYDVGTFERAGAVPPSDLDGLARLADELRATGTPAFAVGGGDGWPLTDWFENLFLRLAGARRYDALAAHRLAWTDPAVRRTLTVMARLLAPPLVAGGPRGALAASFEDSVSAVVARPPAAAMVVEGDFVAGTATGLAPVELGVDLDVFPFPERRPSVRQVVGGGDVAVLMRPSPAGRALLRHLATAEAAETWARLGGFLSPNEDVDLAAYPDDITRSMARALLEAGDGFRFDLSDLQPVAFGGTRGAGMRGILQQFLADPRDVDGTAARLEAAAAAAFTE